MGLGRRPVRTQDCKGGVPSPGSERNTAPHQALGQAGRGCPSPGATPAFEHAPSTLPVSTHPTPATAAVVQWRLMTQVSIEGCTWAPAGRSDLGGIPPEQTLCDPPKTLLALPARREGGQGWEVWGVPPEPAGVSQPPGDEGGERREEKPQSQVSPAHPLAFTKYAMLPSHRQLQAASWGAPGPDGTPLGCSRPTR